MLFLIIIIHYPPSFSHYVHTHYTHTHTHTSPLHSHPWIPLNFILSRHLVCTTVVMSTPSSNFFSASSCTTELVLSALTLPLRSSAVQLALCGLDWIWNAYYETLWQNNSDWNVTATDPVTCKFVINVLLRIINRKPGRRRTKKEDWKERWRLFVVGSADLNKWWNV